MIPANPQIEIFFFRRPFPRIGWVFFQLGLWTKLFFPAKNPPNEESHQKKNKWGIQWRSPKKFQATQKLGGAIIGPQMCLDLGGDMLVFPAQQHLMGTPEISYRSIVKEKTYNKHPWLNSDPRYHRAFFAKFPQIRPGMLRKNQNEPVAKIKNIFLPDLQICIKVSVSEREGKKQTAWWPQNTVIAITSYHGSR